MLQLCKDLSFKRVKISTKIKKKEYLYFQMFTKIFCWIKKTGLLILDKLELKECFKIPFFNIRSFIFI
jgi:hypothetical protein